MNTDVPTRQKSFVGPGSAMDGFMFSTIAIGLIRAWLSLQTGVSSAFETSLTNTAALKLVHSLSITALFIVFGFMTLGLPVLERRRGLALLAGGTGAVAYLVGLLWSDTILWVAVLVTVILDVCTVLMIRIWGEDNCSSDFSVIIVRVGFSFLVQYVAYSCFLVLPKTSQQVLAVLLPIVIGMCLGRAPRPVFIPGSAGQESAFFHLPKVKIALLAVTICFSCFGHAVLFSLLGTTSSIWTLGVLAIAMISLSIAAFLRNSSVLRGMVCITLLFQCLGVIPILVSGFDSNWISLSRSFSYSASMMLTMSIGCWVGASIQGHKGRSVCRWLSLYFVSFYVAYYAFAFLELDVTSSLVFMILCLVFAALPMVSSEWGISASSIRISGKLPSIAPEQLQMARLACQRIAADAHLTPKEHEVLLYMAEGLSADEIARTFQVSKNTIRTQIQSAYAKLSVHNRSELQSLIEERIKFL